MTLSYDYYPNTLRVIDLISQGRTTTYACDEVGITISAFKSHVNQHLELQQLLEEAETRGYDAMADMLVTIDHHGHYAQSDPKMAKVISDNIKWLLEKRKSKQYGQRVEVTHNLTVDKAITDALNAGRHRAALAQQSYVDATFTVVEEQDPELAALLS